MKRLLKPCKRAAIRHVQETSFAIFKLLKSSLYNLHYYFLHHFSVEVKKYSSKLCRTLTTNFVELCEPDCAAALRIVTFLFLSPNLPYTISVFFLSLLQWEGDTVCIPVLKCRRTLQVCNLADSHRRKKGFDLIQQS